MANEAIKNASKTAGVRLWEVADTLGIADSTFCRQLRREFTEEKRERVLAVIEQIAAAKK